MKSVIDPNNARTTFLYDAAGRKTSQTIGSGIQTTYTYDAASRVTRIANVTSGGTMLSSYDYTLDSAGFQTQIVEHDGMQVLLEYNENYQQTRDRRWRSPSWDSFTLEDWQEWILEDWLQMPLSGQTGTIIYDDQLTYDPVGNRLLRQGHTDVTTYIYDAANQIQKSNVGCMKCTTALMFAKQVHFMHPTHFVEAINE